MLHTFRLGLHLAHLGANLALRLSLLQHRLDFRRGLRESFLLLVIQRADDAILFADPRGILEHVKHLHEIHAIAQLGELLHHGALEEELGQVWEDLLQILLRHHLRSRVHFEANGLESEIVKIGVPQASATKRIKEYLALNPNATGKEAAEAVGVTLCNLRRIKSINGLTSRNTIDELMKIVDDKEVEIAKLKDIIRTLIS